MNGRTTQELERHQEKSTIGLEYREVRISGFCFPPEFVSLGFEDEIVGVSTPKRSMKWGLLSLHTTCKSPNWGRAIKFQIWRLFVSLCIQRQGSGVRFFGIGRMEFHS
jgi:hypothetical protein